MTANEAQIEHWNSEEARHWVDQQDQYDRMLAPFGEAVLGAAAIATDELVLDVGCGTGTTTLAAAAAARAGEALGVDLSSHMVERARRRASEGGVPNARFEVADAQTVAFDPNSRDVVISRFGVMFFDDPTRAFANIGSGMRAGGRLAFVCWQGLAQNEWMLVPGMAVAQVVPLPDTRPGAPGPFAFGDPDYVRTVLQDARFRDVDLDPMDQTVLIGGGISVDDAVEWFQHTGMARVLFRDRDADSIARAVDLLRAALAEHEGPDGVRLGGAAWVVRAQR